MTDKQLIRQEIERRIDLYSIVEKDDSIFARIGELSSLTNFIDSLTEEPVSEDLEIEIENYINRNFSEGCDGGMLSDSEPNLGGVTYCDLAKLARHFAEWKDEQVKQEMIEKAVEWMKDHAYDYSFMGDTCIEEFKPAMKGE